VPTFYCRAIFCSAVERVNITTIRSRGGEDDVGQLQASCEYAILTEVSGNILPCLIIRLANHFQDRPNAASSMSLRASIGLVSATHASEQPSSDCDPAIP
jgi:hypothetical protein